jgi:hypothetical protein
LIYHFFFTDLFQGFRSLNFVIRGLGAVDIGGDPFYFCGFFYKAN